MRSTPLPSLATIASRLRLKQLRLLIALDNHGSLHKAADEIAISQPGATKALREIEDILGMALFERQPKGLVANELGQCVTRYARLIYSDLEHLHAEITAIAHGHGGHLAVGVIMGAIPLLTRAITAVREQQPHLSVEIIENTSATLLALLDEGRIDLALCRCGVSRRPGAYDCMELEMEPLAVVAAPSHRLAGESSLALADLAGLPWMAYPVNTPMRNTLERELGDAGIDLPRYPLETASAFAMLTMLQETPDLVAVMPRAVAEFGERFGMLVRLPVAMRALEDPYGVITRTGTQLSPGARLLIDALRAHRTAPLPDEALPHD
ncbi:LysR family transcriptional regulator [Cupriavidus pampae]|uniref:HTH-type transcriptional regulator GbpR n=1 Tax=Cupriavidus pampae TaxID=659251 RepID=A0ABN7ZBJ2_9BURK|nr:LysR family transcriptional regulator [Cupriavidus pampae]CAG9182588.1 HTH-type transcriptional regulator GbpR [Cupriavidus pampae]